VVRAVSFSLKGLGEPLEQLRKLIKDIWYGNAQAKARGELDLLQTKLALANKYGLTLDQLDARLDTDRIRFGQLETPQPKEPLLLDKTQAGDTQH
jgi:hypothetical protein